MKAKEISVSIKYVKNLGNYQSFAAEASIVVVVDPGEDTGAVFNEVWAQAKEQVKSQLKKGLEVEK